MPVSDEVIQEIVKRLETLEREMGVQRSQKLYYPPSAFSTNRTLTLGLEIPNFSGSTIVDVFGVAALNIPPGQITRMRITFKAAAAESFTIGTAYIGHAAITGNAYDFLDTPEQIFFSSGSASVVVPAGGTSTSDLIPFHYNKTSALVIAFYPNGGAGSDAPKYATGFSNIDEYHQAGANESGTVAKTAGYTAVAGRDVAVSLIESNGF